MWIPIIMDPELQDLNDSGGGSKRRNFLIAVGSSVLILLLLISAGSWYFLASKEATPMPSQNQTDPQTPITPPNPPSDPIPNTPSPSIPIPIPVTSLEKKERRIFFATQNRNSIVSVDERGNDKKIIFTSDDSDISLVAVSPDGKNILFKKWFQLFLINAESTGNPKPKLLGSADSEIFSQDGKLVAFFESSSKKKEIFVTNLEGEMRSDKIPIPLKLKFKKLLQFTQDGNGIVCSDDKDNQFIVNIATNQIEALEKESNYPLNASPNGQKIYYTEPIDEKTGLFISNPDGSEKTKIGEYEAPRIFACWHQDGKSLLVSANKKVSIIKLAPVVEDEIILSQITTEKAIW
jgi:Tol biopolymer transport system component